MNTPDDQRLLKQSGDAEIKPNNKPLVLTERNKEILRKGAQIWAEKQALKAS
ncbi:MAG: hypothetical protein AAGA75_17125 [Cyanobacteria bacterium P01_E01_bin.6]